MDCPVLNSAKSNREFSICELITKIGMERLHLLGSPIVKMVKVAPPKSFFPQYYIKYLYVYSFLRFTFYYILIMCNWAYGMCVCSRKPEVSIG